MPGTPIFPSTGREWLVSGLTLAGAIPFIALAAAHVFGLAPMMNPGLLASYWGFTILMFMAGTHWGIAIASERMISPNMFIASNAVVLLMCAALLFSPIRLSDAPLLLAIGFGVLLYFDRAQHRHSQITPFYYRLRLLVSGLVIASLCVASIPMG